MAETFWKEYIANIKSYNYDEYIIHIIPTTNPHGNNLQYYIVVHDDAHFFDTGKTEILSEKELNDKYKLFNTEIT